MNFNSKKETADKKGADEATKLQDEQVNASEENSVSDNVTDEGPEQKELEELKKKYDELNDSHLRLMAEFDNYRKRTLREKSELIKNGGESALTHLLPVVDDFERALQNIRSAEDKGCYGRSGTYLFEIHVLPVSSECKTDRNCR